MNEEKEEKKQNKSAVIEKKTIKICVKGIVYYFTMTILKQQAINAHHNHIMVLFLLLRKEK